MLYGPINRPRDTDGRAQALPAVIRQQDRGAIFPLGVVLPTAISNNANVDGTYQNVRADTGGRGPQKRKIGSKTQGNFVRNTASVSLVVRQHIDDAVVLYGVRKLLKRAPHVALRHLRRFDDRIAAHLDGLAIAADEGLKQLDEAFSDPDEGKISVAASVALQSKNQRLLDRLLAIVSAVPEWQAGLTAALCWVERPLITDKVPALLSSTKSIERLVGVTSCSVHRADPGPLIRTLMRDAETSVRARTLRCAGELGKRELVSELASISSHEEPECRAWAAWSAVMLGARENARAFLKQVASEETPITSTAMQLSLLAMSAGESHNFLRTLSQDARTLRRVMQGAGYSGDPTYIPWLIGHMADDTLAQLAGESFSLITGLDLAWLDLERKPPENLESGPNDNPNDPNVAMDEDDGLPWPDQAKIQAWWNANKHRFQNGARYFMGAPVTRVHCINVLKNGYQRQRMCAALYLCLLNPGAPLFNTSAPAWRQQLQLAQMV